MGRFFNMDNKFFVFMGIFSVLSVVYRLLRQEHL